MVRKMTRALSQLLQLQKRLRFRIRAASKKVS